MGLSIKIRIGFNTLGAQGIPRDIQMGIIHRTVLVRSGGYTAEWFRVKKLPPPERGSEHVAIAFTTIQS
jgi:hypothetical protein